MHRITIPLSVLQSEKLYPLVRECSVRLDPNTPNQYHVRLQTALGIYLISLLHEPDSKNKAKKFTPIGYEVESDTTPPNAHVYEAAFRAVNIAIPLIRTEEKDRELKKRTENELRPPRFS